MAIHPTAIIDPSSEIDSSASVGPYTLIGPRVRVGPDTEIMGHVFIDKDTDIGRGCRIFPFASLGADPQDMKYAGERSQLVVGDEVIVRESTTIHRGTKGGGGVTSIGKKALIMASVHVAHDCRLGDRVILSSFAVLAGHVSVQDQAIISGSSAVHQFVRLGVHSFLGGMTGATKDVPPYMIVAGVRDKDMVVTPNVVGLRRSGFSKEAVSAITGAFKMLHNHKPLAGVLEEVEAAYPDSEEVKVLTSFYRTSERGVYR
ncbi:MAG: acyl-ACP--UDP-N-acetylglucosamine O-acyltransferase [Deltaproteobacteria bacterium]|jgi:UDP-N-acetylglucosamine acyltransferase|nr:acyl-ACP--UDP-N-acetylglucosamine O-acyltransferase [Deltaproteobacteria bacterium]